MFSHPFPTLSRPFSFRCLNSLLLALAPDFSLSPLPLSSSFSSFCVACSYLYSSLPPYLFPGCFLPCSFCDLSSLPSPSLLFVWNLRLTPPRHSPRQRVEPPPPPDRLPTLFCLLHLLWCPVVSSTCRVLNLHLLFSECSVVSVACSQKYLREDPLCFVMSLFVRSALAHRVRAQSAPPPRPNPDFCVVACISGVVLWFKPSSAIFPERECCAVLCWLSADVICGK
mmetsp:Transcript_22189/g.44886  ORF Transcript_22189/g.44886 Transcript_22189/m.44886 type:complete len:226 (+) Transcript_22189:200-877(+)